MPVLQDLAEKFAPSAKPEEDPALKEMMEPDPALQTGFVDMAMQAIPQGATYRNSDEMGAGLQAWLGRLFGDSNSAADMYGDYKQSVGENRADIKQAQEDWPRAYPALEAAGSVIPAYLMARVAPAFAAADTLRGAANVGGLTGAITGFGGSDHGLADGNFGGLALDTTVGAAGGYAAGPVVKVVGDYLAPYLEKAGVNLSHGAANAMNRIADRAKKAGLSKQGEHFAEYSQPVKDAFRAVRDDFEWFGGARTSMDPKFQRDAAGKMMQNIDETVKKGFPAEAPPFDLAGAINAAEKAETQPLRTAAKEGFEKVKDMIVDKGLAAAGGAAGYAMGGPEAGLAGYAIGHVANKFVRGAGRSLLNNPGDVYRAGIQNAAASATQSAANYLRATLPPQISEVVAGRVAKHPELQAYADMLSGSEKPEVTHYLLMKNDPAYRAMMADDGDE